MSTITESNAPVAAETAALAAHLSSIGVNLLANKEQRNEFTHELDSAIDMYTNARSVPFFRNLINERQFPLTAKQAKMAAPAKRAEWQHKCPVCIGTARAEHIGWLVGMRDRVSSVEAFDDLARRIKAVQDLSHACEIHEIERHQSRDELAATRPEMYNIAWKQWLGDPTRSLVIVRQSRTDTRQVSTGIFESEAREITFDRFYVVMVEEAVLRFRTEHELNVANMVYFGRGEPLAKWFVQPEHTAMPLKDGSLSKDRRKPKTWTAWEPVEEFHGEFTDYDEAERCCKNWKHQLNAEYYDNMDAWLEKERPSTSKWTKDAQ